MTTPTLTELDLDLLCTIERLLEALAKAEAERDAAIKCVEAADKIVAAFEPAIADAMAEGERRATAAIVAWLRGDALGVRKHGYFGDDLADAIERGEHLTEAKPPVAPPVERNEPFGRESSIRPGFFEDDME
jgi:hypothetical protein